MNVIKPPVAENGDNIFRLQHRCDALHDCGRVLLIECRPSVTPDYLYNCLGIQALLLGDLLKLRHLRDENAIGQFEGFR